ncbi:MAG: reverse transcriptase, partial [Bacteroidales bacterium]
MKRINNLFDKICSIENLELADERARKGKKGTYGVRVHDHSRESNIKSLHESLINGLFKTSEYDIFKIYEPKERIIYRLPYYPDRIVHHAIMNIMKPIFVNTFTADTYSCIENRGIHLAAKRLKNVLRKDSDFCKYCLKIDIKKFYPSVDHGVLKSLLRRKIKDVGLLSLLDEIIDGADGLPIGNYLSQYLSNYMLCFFDHKVKEVYKVKHYFR